MNLFYHVFRQGAAAVGDAPPSFECLPEHVQEAWNVLNAYYDLNAELS